jgi:hypothetical protein
MAPGASLRPVPSLVAGMALLAVMATGCVPAATPGTPNAPISPVPQASPGAASIGPSPSIAGRDAPPDAALAAEGGDPVSGQLGTYVWLESGNDSPWLRGSPLAVGPGEPLAVSLVPDGDVAAWTARYVPAAAQGPEGAITLGQGTGSPKFSAPGPGNWTVELAVEFAAGAGQASYFWQLEVE